jgi:DNA modification methylase
MGGSDEEKFDHPTQKPVVLMRRPILNHTEPDEWIYEPFSGSGTTLVAAETTSRRCAASELDPRYVDVALRRWQDISGKPAILEATGSTFEETAKQRGKDVSKGESI